MRRDSRSQSETVGVVLLIGVVVTVVFVVGAVVLSNQATDRDNVVSIDAEMTSQNLTLEHTGGNSIEIAELAIVLRGENSERYELSELNQLQGPDPTRFEAGDIWLGNHSVEGDRVTIMLVNTRANEELDRVTVAVRKTLAARFTYSPTSPDIGETVTFDGSASSDPESSITSYEWRVDGSVEGTGPTLDYTFSSPGEYDVTLTVENAEGTTASRTRTVTVGGEEPTAEFTFNNSNPSPGQSVEFNASLSSSPNGNITDYFWEFGDGTTATGEVVTHNYTTSGNYDVTLTVVDEFDRTADETKQVVVESATLPSGDVAFEDLNQDGTYDAGEPSYTASEIQSFDTPEHLIVVRDANGTSGFDIEAERLVVRENATMEPDSGDVTLKSRSGMVVIAGDVDATNGGGSVTVEAQSSSTEVTGTIQAPSTATVKASGGDLSVLGGSVTSDQDAVFSSTGRMYLNDSTVAANTVSVDSNDNAVVFDRADVTVRQESFNLDIESGIWGRNATVSVGPSDATIVLNSGTSTVTVDGATFEPAAKMRLAADGTVSAADATLSSSTNNVELDSTNGDIDINGTTATAGSGEVRVDTTGNVSMADAEIASELAFLVEDVERIRGDDLTATVTGSNQDINLTSTTGDITLDRGQLTSTEMIVVEAAGNTSAIDSTLDSRVDQLLTANGDVSLDRTAIDTSFGEVRIESTTSQITMDSAEVLSYQDVDVVAPADILADNSTIETTFFSSESDITLDGGSNISVVGAAFDSSWWGVNVTADRQVNATDIAITAPGYRGGTVELTSQQEGIALDRATVEAYSDVFVDATGVLEARNATIQSNADSEEDIVISLQSADRTNLNGSTVVAKSGDSYVGNISATGITAQANDANFTADGGFVDVSADGAITANRTRFDAADDVVVLDTDNNVLLANSTVLSQETFNVTTSKSIVGPDVMITVNGGNSNVELNGRERVTLDRGNLDAGNVIVVESPAAAISMENGTAVSDSSQAFFADGNVSLNGTSVTIGIGSLFVDSGGAATMYDFSSVVVVGGIQEILADDKILLDESSLDTIISFGTFRQLDIESRNSRVSMVNTSASTPWNQFITAENAITLDGAELTTTYGGGLDISAGTNIDLRAAILDTIATQTVVAGSGLNATDATFQVSNNNDDIVVRSDSDMQLVDATLDSGSGGSPSGGPQVGGGGGGGKPTMFVSGARFLDDGNPTTFQCDDNPFVDGTPTEGSVSCKQGGGPPGGGPPRSGLETVHVLPLVPLTRRAVRE